MNKAGILVRATRLGCTKRTDPPPHPSPPVYTLLLSIVMDLKAPSMIWCQHRVEKAMREGIEERDLE